MKIFENRRSFISVLFCNLESDSQKRERLISKIRNTIIKSVKSQFDRWFLYNFLRNCLNEIQSFTSLEQKLLAGKN